MLVLTRKKFETIRIGDDIVIKVVQTGRGRVKLGIEAPADMRVLRGELEPYETELSDLMDVRLNRLTARPWESVHEFANN